MNTNLTAHYMALETERARLPRLAERGWFAEEADAAHRSLPTRRTLLGRFVGFLTSSSTWHLRAPQATAVDLH